MGKGCSQQREPHQQKPQGCEVRARSGSGEIRLDSRAPSQEPCGVTEGVGAVLAAGHSWQFLHPTDRCAKLWLRIRR